PRVHSDAPPTRREKSHDEVRDRARYPGSGEAPARVGEEESTMSKPKTRTLGAVLYEDFELLDLYGPLEMFGSIGAELRIVTVAEKTGPVASFQRPQSVAEFDFASAPMLDLILLPGGFGTIPQLENPAMLDFLRRRAATAEVTMSVCSGSAILAKAGLLDGRRATSNKQFFDLARAQGAAVK